MFGSAGIHASGIVKMEIQNDKPSPAKQHAKRRQAPGIPPSGAQVKASDDVGDLCSRHGNIFFQKTVDNMCYYKESEFRIGESNTQFEDENFETQLYGNLETINISSIPKHEFMPKKVPIDVNLPVKCSHLIDLLQRLQLHMGPVLNLPDGTIKNAILERAIYRYESLWLPLAARYRLYSGAPVDVQWLWLAHMLDPTAYRLDCQRMTGTLVNHRLVSQKRFYRLTQRARKLWNLRYPKQPFAFIAYDNATVLSGEQFREDSSVWAHKISRKLLRSIAETHHEFLYQVSLPHFKHVELLREAAIRYQRYLFLRKAMHYQCNYPTTTDSADNHINLVTFDTPVHLLPTDILLCWRAHLYQPSVYSHNSACQFGKLLPYYSDRQIDDKRDANWMHQFAVHWREAFPGHPLCKSGFFQRPLVGTAVFQTLTNMELYAMSTKCAKVVIESITLKFPHSVDKFALTIRRTAVGSSKENELNIDLATNSVVRLTSADFRGYPKSATSENIHRHSGGMRMVSGICDAITFELVDKRGWICPSNAVLGYGQLNLIDTLENFMGTATLQKEVVVPIKGEVATSTFRQTIPCEEWVAPFARANGCPPSQLKAHPKLVKPTAILLDLAIDPPNRHAVHLQVKLGVELVCKLPPPSPCGSGIWGPVSPSFGLSSRKHVYSKEPNAFTAYLSEQYTSFGRFHHFHMDTGRSLVLIHQILNHTGQHVLTVRVLHNVILGLSVVQVYSGQSLLAAGHQLHSEHLPEVTTNKKTNRRSTTVNRTLSYIKTYCFKRSAHRNAMDNFSSKQVSSNDGKDNAQWNMDSIKDQLEPNNPSTWCLQPGRSERAMLVKDVRGDWCLLIGAWTGFKRQPSDTVDAECSSENGNSFYRYCSTRGNCGQLTLRARWLGSDTGDTSFTQIPDTLNDRYIMLKDMSVNMKTGKIIIRRTCPDVAQYVCLAFCCSILHVLCQPRIITPEVSGELNFPNSDSNRVTLEKRATEDNGANRSVQQTSQHISCISATQTPASVDASVLSTTSKRMSRVTPTGTLKKRFSWSVNPLTQSTLYKEYLDPNKVEVIGGVKIHCSNLYVRQVYSLLAEDDAVNLHTQFRKPMASLSYIMCRASGLPFDALIPSVQFLRYMERFSKNSSIETTRSPHNAFIKQKNEFFGQNSAKYPYPNSTQARTLPNGSNYSSFKETTIAGKDDRNHNKEIGARYNRIPKVVATQDDGGSSSDSLQYQKHHENLPHVGFRLIDFYDLFLLPLPDICSGCLDGCKFCNGSVVW